MDVDAEAALDGASLTGAGDALEELLLRVLEGEQTKAELNGQNGIICLYSTHSSF